MAGYQQMRIMRDGKEVKVSKRLGQFITVEELIDQVGQPVALFFTLMRSAESHMDLRFRSPPINFFWSRIGEIISGVLRVNADH
jgi:hypothetical protein